MVSLTDTTEQLVPAENLGMCFVYMDYLAYAKHRHKQLALNLYIVAMCQYVLVPLCEAFNDSANAAIVKAYGEEVQRACVKKFWSKEKKIFINNLP